jgi:DNA-directed RNA polymerase specialized sigma subunit
MLTDEHKKKIKYLSQLKYINRGIDRKISEMNKWKCRATNITTILSGMPRGSTTDKISDCVANIADLNKEIEREIDKLVDKKKEIECKINAIEDDRLRNILIDRYLYYMTWEEIAWKNNYSWQHVYRLHEKGLNLIEI